MACLRPGSIGQEEDEDEEEEEERKPLLLPTSASCPHLRLAPRLPAAQDGGDEVFHEEEEAYGSFFVVPHPQKPLPAATTRRRRRFNRSSSSNTSHGSTSSDPDNSTSSLSAASFPRPRSIKRLFQRSMSALLRPSGSDKSLLEEQSLDAATVMGLQDFGESLLHVFRTSTFPPEGLRGFYDKLSWVVEAGGEGLAGQWWAGEVVPRGARLLGARVANPRHGDQVVAVAREWRGLYTTILPLLRALLAPLQRVEVREDVLRAFRDTVLPLADLPALAAARPQALQGHVWSLTQMALLLASVGPCSCDLRDDEEKRRDERRPDKQRIAQHKENMAIEVLRALAGSQGGLGSDNGGGGRLVVGGQTLTHLLHLHHGGAPLPAHPPSHDLHHLQELEAADEDCGAGEAGVGKAGRYAKPYEMWIQGRT